MFVVYLVSPLSVFTSILVILVILDELCSLSSLVYLDSLDKLVKHSVIMIGKHRLYINVITMSESSRQGYTLSI
jgi:hypothetical protein